MKPHADWTHPVGNIMGIKKDEIDKEKFKKIQNGEFEICLLGGIAVTQAKINMMSEDRISEDPKYARLNKVKIDLYCDCDDTEATKLGIDHNEIHKLAEGISFMDTADFFRRRILIEAGRGPNDEVPTETRGPWNVIIRSKSSFNENSSTEKICCIHE